MAGAPVPVPQPVVVTNAVDVRAIATPIHTILDNPLPLPVSIRRPVEFVCVSTPVPLPANFDFNGWTRATLNGYGTGGWRLVAALQDTPGAVNTTFILEREL
jgi:hypothetical protein